MSFNQVLHEFFSSLCQRYGQIQSKLNEIPESVEHLVELTTFTLETNDKTVFALLREVQVSAYFYQWNYYQLVEILRAEVSS